jgi:hypothetical protein
LLATEQLGTDQLSISVRVKVVLLTTDIAESCPGVLVPALAGPRGIVQPRQEIARGVWGKHGIEIGCNHQRLATRRALLPARYEVVLPRLPFLEQHSVANVQGLGSLPTVRLERRLGTLPDATIVQNPALPECILYSRVGGGDTAPETLTPAGTIGGRRLGQDDGLYRLTNSFCVLCFCCDALTRWIMPAWYNGCTTDTSSEKSRYTNG